MRTFDGDVGEPFTFVMADESTEDGFSIAGVDGANPVVPIRWLDESKKETGNLLVVAVPRVP